MAQAEIRVPDIGDFDEVTVIELLVKPGDSVKAEQSLITVESDKASMEIPSSSAGTLTELKVKIGDKVKQGTLLAVLEVSGSSSEKASEAATVEASLPAATAPVSRGEAAPASAQASPEGAPTQAASSSAPASATAPPAVQAGASAQIEARVPDIGDFKDLTVIEVLVKPGDTVKVEQSLITIESDKASMEIPSSAAGVIKELKVKLGDKVNVGDLLAVLEGAGAARSTASPAPAADRNDAPASATTVAATAQAAAPSQAVAALAAVPSASDATGGIAAQQMPAYDPTVPPQGNLPHASPSVRKFARELGVPLDEVKGSGPKGRIIESDVQSFTRSVMSGTTRTQQAAAAQGATGASGSDGAGLGLIPWPKIDFSKYGPVQRKDVSRIRKISGANLHRNWVMIPHVTNHDDADITDLEAFRVATNKENEGSGTKVTMLAFLIKACVAALRHLPDFNASLEGEQLVLKQYYHIGFAADTPNGLMVPVLKDADKKGVLQISQEMAELAKKARDGKLSPAEMSGASFTISSLGGIGGRYFTPIINAPEVAILGVCRSSMEPVWNGSAFVPRLMLPLSLSWDHRVIDGASAARFNVYLARILGDFRRVLL
ncbi:MAG: dihydrolipoyllysine-residue acetyltransferase [Burkholderiaceae bacterium]